MGLDGKGTQAGEDGPAGVPGRRVELGQMQHGRRRQGSPNLRLDRRGDKGFSGAGQRVLDAGPASVARPEELEKVVRIRWAIEECFEEAKGQVSLDQYECAGGMLGITISTWRCEPTPTLR